MGVGVGVGVGVGSGVKGLGGPLVFYSSLHLGLMTLDCFGWMFGLGVGVGIGVGLRS